MIITCQQCLTSYSLDEERLDNTGSRVRCTSCGYVFVTFPQGVYPSPADSGPQVRKEITSDSGNVPADPVTTKGDIAGAVLGKSADELDFLQDTTTELEALGVTEDDTPVGEEKEGQRVLAPDSRGIDAEDSDGFSAFEDHPADEPEVASLDSLSEDIGRLDGLASGSDIMDDGIEDFGESTGPRIESGGDLRLELDEPDMLLEEEKGDLDVEDIEGLLDLDMEEATPEAIAEESGEEIVEDTVDLNMDQLVGDDDGDETPPAFGDVGGLDLSDMVDVEEVTDSDMLVSDDDISVSEELDLGDLEAAIEAADDAEDMELDIDFNLGEEKADEPDLDLDLDLDIAEEPAKPSDDVGGSVDLDVALALETEGSDGLDLDLDLDQDLDPDPDQDQPGDIEDLDLDLDLDLAEEATKPSDAEDSFGGSVDLDVALELGTEGSDGLDLDLDLDQDLDPDSDQELSGDTDGLELDMALDAETGDIQQDSKGEASISGIEEVLELEEDQDDLLGMDSADFDFDLEEDDEAFGKDSSEIGMGSQDLDIEDIESMLDIKGDTTRERSDSTGDTSDELDLSDIESVLDLSTEESVEPEDEELSLDMQMITGSEKGSDDSNLETEELDISDIEKMLELDGDTAEMPVQEEDEKPLEDDIDKQDVDVDLEMEPVSLARTGDNVTANVEDTAALNLGEMDDMFELAEDSEADGDSLDLDLDLDLSLDVASDERDELVDLPLSEDTAELDLSEFDESGGGDLGADDGEIFDTTDLDLDIEIDESSAEETSPETEGEAEMASDAYTGTVELGNNPPPVLVPDPPSSSPPPVQQAASRAVKTTKKKKKLGMPVIIILILLLLVGGGFAAIKVMSSMGIPIPSIPYVSDFFAPEVKDTAGTLKIKTINVTNRFVDNEKIGRLFIISGEVRNDYPDSRRYIKLTGKLLSKGGKVAQKEWVYCGNTLDDLELSSLDATAVAGRLHNRYAGGLSSGKNLPFMVVFNSLPPDMEEYTIEVTGSFSMK